MNYKCNLYSQDSPVFSMVKAVPFHPLCACALTGHEQCLSSLAIFLHFHMPPVATLLA